MDVRFYDEVEDSKLDFAVIVSKYEGQWVYCKHKERTTFEVPGGHRETGESIIQAAERELYEETGAIDFTLRKICVYSVVKGNTETFGMLFFAEIKEFGKLPDMEIDEVKLFDTIPSNLTYPLIQPELIHKVNLVLGSN